MEAWLEVMVALVGPFDDYLLSIIRVSPLSQGSEAEVDITYWSLALWADGLARGAETRD